MLQSATTADCNTLLRLRLVVATMTMTTTISRSYYYECDWSLRPVPLPLQPEKTAYSLYSGTTTSGAYNRSVTGSYFQSPFVI